MPYILSPEQKVVVDALLCKETSSTKYFDIVTAVQSISKGCVKALREGKNILVHIPNEDKRNILKNMFLEIGLDDLTIDLSSKQSMPEVDIIKLRSTLKKQNNSDAIIKHVLSNKRAGVLANRIAEYYNAFDTKVMSDKPFRDFATNAIYNKNQERPALMVKSNPEIKFQFSAIEYYNVKKEINTAAQTYHRQYDLYDHLSLFKEELWSEISDSSIAKIKEQLSEFQKESVQLVYDFLSVTNDLENNSIKELNQTFKDLENKFHEHEESCIAFQIKSTADITTNEGIFSVFKKKKPQASNKIYVDAFDELSGIIQSLSKKWYDALEAPTSEMITYEYILKFIQENRDKAIEYKKEINKNLQNSIQRINKINTSSEDVKSLDRRLEALIQKMNASNLFDITLEHNILSFVKQVELSKNISDYIEKCNILVHSSFSYLEWKSFYNASGDIFRLIFDELKKLPKNLWIASLENWYENQIQDHVLGQKIISQNDIKEYFALHTTSNQIEVSSLIAELQSVRINGAEQLKKTTKELHNTLFKKKQLPSASWKNTALMNRSFMQSFFPIHITDSLAHESDYNLVISFSEKDESKDSKVHYFSPIQSKDIQNIADRKNNFLYLNDYSYKGTLAQLSSTEKLKAAKKLAKYILSLNQNIKIYQLKNANIISLLPTHDDSYLEHHLDNLNVKTIDTNGVLYNRLTESILFTDRKPYLIIKDNLINSELHDHILWQLKILQLFDNVGYEVVSLNTSEQLADNTKAFGNILKMLGGQVSEAKEVQTQSQSELPVVQEEI